MDTILNFWSPVKSGPAAPLGSESQTPSAGALWARDDGHAHTSLGPLFSPAVNERNRASPAAVAAAKYAHEDFDDVHEPQGFQDNMYNVGTIHPAATEYSFVPPQARRSARTSEINPGNANDVVQADEDDAEFAFKRFLAHRKTGNANDIEIQVEWERGAPTWEPEVNLHRDAPETLFAYWESQGGRPLNPQDPDLFDIFAIRKHSKNKKRLQVEWLGYDKSEWSWLPREAVEETAREVVEAYWQGLKKK